MKRFAGAAVLAGLMAVLLVTPGVAAKKCKTYSPGTYEADGGILVVDVEPIVVTDRATEAEPLEMVVEVPPGTPIDDGHKFFDLQVDTAKRSTGLFVRWEFPLYEVNDLYLYTPDGAIRASGAGFNPAPVGTFDGTGDGGHSEQGAEQIDGLKTKGCGGYTVDLWAYTHQGGETVLKVWLDAPQK